MENLHHKNVSLSLIAEYGASDSDSDNTETELNTGNDDSDSVEISEMVLKNNIINACAHGPLTGSSIREDEQTSRHMIIDNFESGIVEYEVTEYRDDTDSDTSSSSNSNSNDSDVDSVKDIEEISSGEENEEDDEDDDDILDIVNHKEKPEAPRVHGELGLDDLPPIEDLAISLPSQDTTKIGTIASIVDRLVIVRAFPETPAVDLDSVLFLENGAKALGKVFDVFGPVTEPHYCIRFNSVEHVRERGIQPGMEVFIAPRSQHTNYVFLHELMKVKGSDASWQNDVEPPPTHLEYSDDEEERKANRARRELRLNRQQDQESENDGETSKNRRVLEVRRNQRPFESSSRFGSGPSRGRNPFSAGSRRNNPNSFPRYARPMPGCMNLRTPPPQLNNPGSQSPYSAPVFSPNVPPPMFPPPFNPSTPPFIPSTPPFNSSTPSLYTSTPPFNTSTSPFNPSTPPPFIGNTFQFGGNPRMHTPIPPISIPPFRHTAPVFGANFCNIAGPQPQWANNEPPPPGT